MLRCPVAPRFFGIVHARLVRADVNPRSNGRAACFTARRSPRGGYFFVVSYRFGPLVVFYSAFGVSTDVVSRRQRVRVARASFPPSKGSPRRISCTESPCESTGKKLDNKSIAATGSGDSNPLPRWRSRSKPR